MKTVWSAKGLKQYNTRLAFRTKCESADRIELVALDFYNIYVNDQFVGYGPAKTTKGYARRDVYDLREYKDFYITIEVCCHNIGAYSFASCNPLFGAEIYLDDKVVMSTNDFDCFNLDVAVQKVQKYSYQRGFSESYVMEKDPSFFRTGKMDYSKADVVEVDCPIILDRIVDYLEYNFAPATKIESGYFDIDKNKEHWYEEYQMLHIDNRNHCFNRDEIEEFVSDTVSEFDYTKQPIDGEVLSAKQYFTYDFNRIVTGLFELKVEVKEDAEIYLSWSEYLEKCEKSYEMDFSRNTCCDIVKWKLKKGTYNLLTFEPYDCKYARINLLSGVVEIKSFGLRCVENKNAQRVYFECENKNLEKIVKAANNTLSQNAVDIFMDCPGRERAGWLCDSYFMGQAEYTLYGHNKVEKAYLENFACINKEMREGYPKGMLPMCFPSCVPSRKYIPNWSLWYILELKEYFKRTSDKDLIERSKKNVLDIVEFFAESENELGLLENLKSWVFVEWSRANDFVNGINYPTNMLYATALKTAGELYGKKDLVDKGNKLINVIRELSFNGEFFEDNAVRDENGNIVKTGNTTETCQYYALFFEVATGIEFEKFAEKMISEFGRKRDYDKVYPLVYKSNAFIGNFIRLMYLLKIGEYKKVLDDCEDYFTYMAEQTDTLWEYDTVMNSMNHGFASYAGHLVLESLKKTGIYDYKFLIRDDETLYSIHDEITFDKDQTLNKGGELSSTFKKKNK